MHDNVSGIDQDPVALILSFDARRTSKSALQSLDKLFAYRNDLPGRSSRTDHHVVRDFGFSAQIDCNDFLGLVLV